MTIDEAIKHAEEVAKDRDETANLTPTEYKNYINRCRRCAEEHRQLAEWLKELKQLREQTRWIPVSERVPEEFQRVLVTIVNYNGNKVVRVAEYYNRRGVGVFQIKENHEQWEVGEEGLLAWMPLPEPYKAEKMIANGIPLPKGHGRKFEGIVVEYPPADLCTYPEYRGKPYFSIKYEENGEHFIGFGTYNPEVFSRYLQEYFFAPTIIEADNAESEETE